jgi:methionyl-tRNA formyltransferase
MPKPKTAKLIVWAKGNRGTACLEAVLRAGLNVRAVVLHPEEMVSKKDWVAGLKRRLGAGVPVLAPADPNTAEFVDRLKSVGPDVFALAGYGKILRGDILNVPRVMSVNLHGGKVPAYRGSSPMNWALIRGEKRFTLSVLRVDSGIDSGDVLLEKTFSIAPSDTIADLHRTADREFPKMLVEVLGRITKRALRGKKQSGPAGYFPLRFAEDGLVVWDLLTAKQVHDRIRALTDPYPGAYAYFDGRKVRLTASRLTMTPFYGEPGRIYQANDKGLLVAAKDRALWITQAFFEKSASDRTAPSAIGRLPRYSRFASAALMVEEWQRSLTKGVRGTGKAAARS